MPTGVFVGLELELVVVSPPEKVVPGSVEKPATRVVVPVGMLVSDFVVPVVIVSPEIEPVVKPVRAVGEVLVVGGTVPVLVVPVVLVAAELSPVATPTEKVCVGPVVIEELSIESFVKNDVYDLTFH